MGRPKKITLCATCRTDITSKQDRIKFCTEDGGLSWIEFRRGRLIQRAELFDNDFCNFDCFDKYIRQITGRETEVKGSETRR